MEELYRKFSETLRENTSLRHQIVDLESALSSKEQELLMAKESSGLGQYLRRIESLERENKRLKDMVERAGQDNCEGENINPNAIMSEEKTENGTHRSETKDPSGELRQYLKTIREYVTGLTGYKMEFRDGEIIFHSLYAFDSEDVFIFRYKSGNMELVNNDFAASWATEVQNYLIAGKSIPAFLAAVTLELFNKKTFG
ncbi:putative MAD domain-containing protein [Encephalitozoon intestinalis ATCC 50506]|uniref:Spindle assembly checkpoint component MAD1 n=1 Tax=Encephalitozoon intestinalis (strain ATCC 50506) TaxID=876142 RepID=E0S5V0_ENCIT|nr:putative MAD domain-containing protein [Encephalitozoon intestinalis ATCC 50506]ADM11085.1 putative MAD domain-containing protein [Encephalitozoon intestinalis ATCC 50506]UTX44739.1 mitotic checkpoint protein [Encephalitozoon intestinalis]